MLGQLFQAACHTLLGHNIWLVCKFLGSLLSPSHMFSSFFRSHVESFVIASVVLPLWLGHLALLFSCTFAFAVRSL